MPDPKAKRLRQVNFVLGSLAAVWVLWLTGSIFFTNDPVSLLCLWFVTVVVGWRVAVHWHFQGEGRVEKVIQKIVRTMDEDNFTHNDAMVYLAIRLTNGQLKKVKFGTVVYAMENNVEVGTSMVKKRWSWSWVPVNEPKAPSELSPPTP